MKYPTIANAILLMQAADLQLRDKLIEEKQLGKGYKAEMEALHLENAQQLEDIIEQIGYPTIEKVGNKASEAAWLVIQHAISAPKFMKKCARMLQIAVIAQEANPINLAYLSDRIATFENRPQLYGTSFDWDETGKLQPVPYDDLSKVNERRQSLGLNTLEEQTAIIRTQAEKENQSPPLDFLKRKQAMDVWRRKVGWID